MAAVRPAEAAKSALTRLGGREISVTDVPEESANGLVRFNSVVRDMLDDMAALLPTFQRRQQARGQITEDLGPRQDVPILLPGAIAKVELLRDLMQGARGATPERWLSMAFEIFPDPSDLAMALAELRRSDGLTPEDLEKIDLAYQALIDTEGKQKILAGVNASASALAFGDRLSLSPADLRQAYRILVMTQLREHVMYRYLIESFGFANRHDVVDYLEVAMACDLRAVNPSCSNEEFSQLWHILYQIRLLRAADLIFVGKGRRERHRRRRRSLKQRLNNRASAHGGNDAHPAHDVVGGDGGNKSDRRRLSDDDFDEREEETLVQLMMAGFDDAATIADRVAEAYKDQFGDGNRAEFTAFLQRLLIAFVTVPIDLFPSLAHRNDVIRAIGEPLKSVHFPSGLIGAKGYIDA